MDEFPESLTLNLISQNMFLDKTQQDRGLILPQSERVDSLVKTLSNFPGELDVVGVQETQGENGIVLAEKAGYPSDVWFQHNKPQPGTKKGRSDEYLGVFGTLVESGEAIDLGDNRKAIVTTIAGVAFILIHLRAGARPAACRDRRLQAKTLVEYADSYDDVVVYGDFNEPRLGALPMARSLFKDNDFISVFDLTNQPRPKTFPSAPYAHLYPPIRFALDDILVRASRVSALSAGTLLRADSNEPRSNTVVPSAESDHEGIWATLRIDP